MKTDEPSLRGIRDCASAAARDAKRAELMGKKPSDAAKHVVSLSDIREYCRELLRCSLRHAENSFSRAQAVETFAVHHHADFFSMLLASDEPAIHREDMPDPSILKQIYAHHLKDATPVCAGCHHRSLGLPRLRSSHYAPTDRYFAKAIELFREQPGGDAATDDIKAARSGIQALREDAKAGFNVSKDGRKRLSRHFTRFLDTYFYLLGRNRTVNEQVFNTNHPRGPIGIAYGTVQPDRRSACVIPFKDDYEQLLSTLRAPLDRDICELALYPFLLGDVPMQSKILGSPPI